MSNYASSDQRWEFIKENKKTRFRPRNRLRKKKENTILTKKATKKKEKKNLFFLIVSWSLSWSLSWSRACCFLL